MSEGAPATSNKCGRREARGNGEFINDFANDIVATDELRTLRPRLRQQGDRTSNNIIIM
jgi:hypothetical protein